MDLVEDDVKRGLQAPPVWAVYQNIVNKAQNNQVTPIFWNESSFQASVLAIFNLYYICFGATVSPNQIIIIIYKMLFE